MSVAVAASFLVSTALNLRAERWADALERRWPDRDPERLDPSERPIPLHDVDVLVLGLGRVSCRVLCLGGAVCHAGHPRWHARRSPYDGAVIFKRVGDGRPYPDHELGPRDWASLPPRPVRLDELVTTKDTLQLAALLDEDSTFYGDLFPHAVAYHDEVYLEDGLHRALRAALQGRTTLHVRILDLDALRRTS